MCVSVALLSLTITNLILLKYIFLNESLLIHRMLFLQTSLSLFLSVANGHILFHLHFTSLFLFSKYLPSSILNLKYSIYNFPSLLFFTSSSVYFLSTSIFNLLLLSFLFLLHLSFSFFHLFSSTPLFHPLSFSSLSFS